ncbi:MAG: esterase-like activity of phytase family protein, partial [Porticoccaceae bacterium]
ATANEGDLDRGGRGFSIFNLAGKLLHDSGNSLEHAVIRAGHYPDKRSDKKGNEPENVAFARYGNDQMLFVGSERANTVAVYQVPSAGAPRFLQLLPTGVGPEGLLPIPRRDLFVAASEKDDRGDKFRSVLSIYRRGAEAPGYPRVLATDRADGTPIPWGALSALALDRTDPQRAYTVHDSFYRHTRIYPLALGHTPALIDGEIVLHDRFDHLATTAPQLVESDGQVNLDAEGLATRADGGFWLVSEGSGSVDDPKRPVTSPDLLLAVSTDGAIERVVRLPATTDARQRRFGLEGVTSVGSDGAEQVYVAFQREWLSDLAGHVRIGRYTPASDTWAFFYYPLDTAISPNGGWVGLSEIAHVGGDTFAVVERDNQGGMDARIKRLYTFSVAGIDPLADPATGTPAFPVLTKTLAADLMPALQATGGAVLEKIEGLAVLPDGDALIVNDNDGVDDSNGETQLLRLESLFD